jgi:hypothetical protein
MGYEDRYYAEAAQDAKLAALSQERGRLEAMLEIQAWAEEHRDMLRGIGLYDSLIRLTVPK